MTWFLIVIFFWSGDNSRILPPIQFATESGCMGVKAHLDGKGIQQFVPRSTVDSYKTWCLAMENPRPPGFKSAKTGGR